MNKQGPRSGPRKEIIEFGNDFGLADKRLYLGIVKSVIVFFVLVVGETEQDPFCAPSMPRRQGHDGKAPDKVSPHERGAPRRKGLLAQ
jgi:hypothetical protein